MLQIFRPCVAALVVLLLCTPVVCADSRHQTFDDFTLPLPLKPTETLVLGIVGGWDRWDNPKRITRGVALQIRDLKIPGVFVETVENHSIGLADELVRRAFPDPAQARLIVYGQSLGGRETVRFCRRMQERGIPIILAVVVDAFGPEDYSIPPNVSFAANLFQRTSHYPLGGAQEIRALDPSRTTILGNWEYKYDYRRWTGKKIEKPEWESGIRWRWMGGHLRLEYDPEVWDKVRGLIVDALSTTSVLSGPGPA